VRGGPLGGLFSFKFSSRPHPRKFGLKRFLAVRKVLAGKRGSLFLSYLLGKNIGGVVALISCPPNVGWMQQSPAVRRVLSFRSEAREVLAVKRREFITLLGRATTGWPLAARGQFKPAIIRVLGSGSAQSSASLIDALNENGLPEGRDLALLAGVLAAAAM